MRASHREVRIHPMHALPLRPGAASERSGRLRRLLRIALAAALLPAVAAAAELTGGGYRLHGHLHGLAEVGDARYRLLVAGGQPVATDVDASADGLRLRAGLFVANTGDRIFHDGFEDDR
jgi:hypothetical protein